MSKTKPSKSYDQMRQELDNIMLELQSEDIDVDQAVAHYQRGLELIEAIQAHLKTARNQVSQLKNKFETE